jgi:hypothetical protein
MCSNRSKYWSIYEFAFDGIPPRELMPPGFRMALHPTRSKNGIITFDVISGNLRFLGKKGRKIETFLRRFVYRYLKNEV